MPVQLDKINPRFRQIVDLLFFSDRMDLDLTEFRSLLKENYKDHYNYAWDRLQKSLDIFWENGSVFWSHRLEFLLSLNDKFLIKNLEEHLEKRMFELIRNKQQINIDYDIEYLQFVEFCKIKYARHDDLSNIKNYLIDLPSHSSIEKLINVVNSFTPFLFKSLNDYADHLVRKITQSCRNFDFLLALEEIAPNNFSLNREPIANLAMDIIMDRVHNDKNKRAFFNLINDKGVLNILKLRYDNSFRLKLIKLLENCDYFLLEDWHLRNIKNILELDSSLADRIVEIYGDKLYSRGFGHKKANADRMIRLAKTFPQISAKKILSFLSTHNKMNDVKYVLSSFPDLKKLAAFV